MAIRVFILFLTLLGCWSKAQDSADVSRVNREYSRYYRTYIRNISPSGKYMVRNDMNAYGKNEDRLVEAASGISEKIVKGKVFHFFNDDYLIVKADNEVCFYDLKSRKHLTVSGFTDMRMVGKKYILLYSRNDKKLGCYTPAGKELWNLAGILLFDMAENAEDIYGVTESRITKISLKSQQQHTVSSEGKIFWLKVVDNQVWVYKATDRSILLKNFDNDLKELSDSKITLPDNYRLNDLKEAFEIREKRYFILPLAKIKKENQNSKVKITYSLKNEWYEELQMGIFDTLKKEWVWMPSDWTENNKSFFLNAQGDFIQCNLAEDLVENKNNAMVQAKLVLDYGRKVIPLGKMPSDKDNFYLDRVSGNLLIFRDRKWIIYNLAKGKTVSLDQFPGQQWVDPRNNGFTERPRQPPIATDDSSKVIVSGTYDLFIVDLKSNQIKRITNGEKDQISYSLIARELTGGSGWSVKREYVDWRKENILKMFSERNYQSGFSTIKEGRITELIFGNYNFNDIVESDFSVFAVSKLYQKPLEVFTMDSGKVRKIFVDNNAGSPNDPNLKMELFHYRTSLKESNAVLLYPKDYDPSKKYPMIVYVYENTSKDILHDPVPNLYYGSGFNFSHYVHQGYFILLPQLQYTANEVPERFIESLKAVVAKSLSCANIDRGRLAVVGVSFGGYESGLAMSNTSLFKTGIMGSMISDLIPYSLSYTNMFPQPNYIRAETQQHSITGSAFDNWERYNTYSPLYHLPKVKEPILIWYGAKDKNIPPAQSVSYFLGLKRLSKPAVLLEYPNEQHQITNQENQLDINVRNWQWMECFLKDKPPADWIWPIIKKAPF